MRKNVLSVIAVLLCVMICMSTLHAQNSTPELQKVFSDKKKLYGYENADKQLVIPYIYSKASDFSNGLAVVQKKNKYGIVNSKGIEVAPFNYQYIEEIKDLHKYIVFKGDVDGTGKPLKGLYGLMDSTANIILPLEYINISREFNVFILTKDKGVKTNTIYPNDYGIANRKGEIIVPVKSREKPVFVNGLCAPVVWDTDVPWKQGLVNSDGKIIIPFEWAPLKQHDDVFAGSKAKGNGYYFMRTDGSRIVDEAYSGYSYEENGLILLKNGEKIGLLTSRGILVPCEYDESTLYKKNETNFTQGTIIVRKGELYGAYNAEGKLIIPVDCNSLWRLNNGLLVATKNNQKALINIEGRMLMPYSDIARIDNFNDGVAVVLDKNYKYGYIDLDGQMVIECKYDVAYEFKNGLADVEIRNVYKGKIDRQGKMVSENILDTPEYKRQEELRKHFNKIIYDDICTAYVPETIAFDNTENKDFGKTRLVLCNTEWGTIIAVYYTIYNDNQVAMANSIGISLQEYNKKNWLEIMDVETMHSDYLADFQGKYKGTEYSFTIKKGFTFKATTFQNKNVVFFLAVGAEGGLPQKDYYDYFINSFRVK